MRIVQVLFIHLYITCSYIYSTILFEMNETLIRSMKLINKPCLLNTKVGT